jgi:hypothetical protein
MLCLLPIALLQIAAMQAALDAWIAKTKKDHRLAAQTKHIRELRTLSCPVITSTTGCYDCNMAVTAVVHISASVVDVPAQHIRQLDTHSLLVVIVMLLMLPPAY